MARLDHFTRRAIRVGAVATVFILLWTLSDALVLLFGAAIVAAAISAMAGGLSRISGLPRAATLLGVVLAIPAGLVGLAYLMSGPVLREVNKLRESLPNALESANAWLVEDSGLGFSLWDILGTAGEGDLPWLSIASYATVGAGGILNALLIMFIGVYLAATPSRYLHGFLRLIPDDLGPRVGHALKAAGDGLQAWLVGQLMSMTVTGVATGAGLWFLGMPMAFSLGFVAGLLAFVPFIGPLFFTAIAVIFAFAEGPTQALHVLLLCIVVQQAEGNLFTPLIQRWAVSLPPLLSVMAVVVFSILFGLMGVLVATPMMVVLMILVEKLYVLK